MLRPSPRLSSISTALPGALSAFRANGQIPRHQTTPDPSDELVKQVSVHIRDLHLLRSKYQHSSVEISAAHLHTLDLVLRIASFKDSDTGTHIVRMGAISALLASALGQSDEWCDLLEQAAPMHDVGKIGIPDAILQKDASLDADEWQVMRAHPTIGAEILNMHDAPVFRLAAEVALTHHEKWDGSGYPQGLKADAIPLAGRIVAVADYIDALTMDRAYRSALDDDTAFDMLATQTGKHFDPQIVECALGIRSNIVNCRNTINELADKPDHLKPQRGIWKRFRSIQGASDLPSVAIPPVTVKVRVSMI